jgi:hypothetical protein
MIACYLANIALRLDRQVNWDVEDERRVSDHEAQSYVTRAYRAPWFLPVV